MLAALVVLAVSGCAGELQNMSSGEIGCASKDVEILDEKTHFGSRTWTAKCAGKTFFCESREGTNFAPGQVNCTESAEETGSTPSQ